MQFILAALFFFAILTLWVPALWPVSVFETGIFALAAFALIRGRRHRPPFSWPLAPLAFAVLWGVLQLLTGRTVYAFDTENAVVRWTAFLAVFFLAISLFRSAPARHAFRAAMLWFSFVVAVLATLQSFTSGGRVFWLFPTPYTDFLMGPFPSRNHYAAFIEVVLPIALFEGLRGHRASLLYSGMAAVMYASVIASASRAGCVLATAEIIAVPLLLWWRGRAGGAAIGFSFLRLAVLLAVFTAIVGPETVWARFLAPDPYALRREFAVSSLHMAAAHPLWGTGLGTWATAYPRYAIIDIGAFANQAHSDWLQWAAEGGIPLLVMLASLFFWSLRPAFRSVWGLGIVAVFLHAMVDYPFSRPALGSWSMLVLGLLAVDERLCTKVHMPKILETK